MGNYRRQKGLLGRATHTPTEQCESLESCILYHVRESILNLERLDESHPRYETEDATLWDALRHARAARAGLEVILARRLPVHYDGKAAAAGPD